MFLVVALFVVVVFLVSDLRGETISRIIGIGRSENDDLDHRDKHALRDARKHLDLHDQNWRF